MKHWISNTLSISGFEKDVEALYLIKDIVTYPRQYDEDQKNPGSFEKIIEFPKGFGGVNGEETESTGKVDVEYVSCNVVFRNDKLRLVFYFLTSWDFVKLSLEQIGEKYNHLDYVLLSINPKIDEINLSGYRKGIKLYDRRLSKGLGGVLLEEIEEPPEDLHSTSLNFAQIKDLTEEHFNKLVYYIKAGMYFDQLEELSN